MVSQEDEMKLTGKTIAVLVEQDYQDMEVWYPTFRLREAGATVKQVGTGSAAEYKGKYGYPVKADINADQVSATMLDGLVIPGGWAPDRLRMSEAVLKLTRDMFAAKKPVACICHGGWVLISADVVRGKHATSYAAIKDDMKNAGALWQDSDVVVDGNLVTSRKPDDLPAFMREFLKLFG
jgi:protease I